MGQYFFVKRILLNSEKNHTVLSHEPAYSQNSILVTTLVIRKTQWRTQGGGQEAMASPFGFRHRSGPKGPTRVSEEEQRSSSHQ